MNRFIFIIKSKVRDYPKELPKRTQYILKKQSFASEQIKGILK